MHEPRLSKSLALGYMVNPHGADHCSSLIDVFYAGFGKEPHVTIGDTRPLGMTPVPFEDIGPRKVALFRIVQLKRILFDSLLLCLFIPYTHQHLAEVTTAVTGWNTTVMEQLRVAERTLTMFRLFNVRHGFTDQDDRLPARFFQPRAGGALMDTALDPERMERAKQYYYALMGWNDKGVPTAEKIEELEIDQPS